MKVCDIPKNIRVGEWECGYSLTGVVRFIEDAIVNGLFGNAKLSINPDFQRGRVWKEWQQISYIEAILRDSAKNARVLYINDPTVANYNNTYNEATLVDGLQRYTAIKSFINNELKAFGCYYNEFEDREVMIDRQHTSIKVNINGLETKRDVLNWYIQLNEGGTPHTKEEIDRVKEMLNKER